jgi:hypothetical protein
VPSAAAVIPRVVSTAPLSTVVRLLTQIVPPPQPPMQEFSCRRSELAYHNARYCSARAADSACSPPQAMCCCCQYHPPSHYGWARQSYQFRS